MVFVVISGRHRQNPAYDWKFDLLFEDNYHNKPKIKQVLVSQNFTKAHQVLKRLIYFVLYMLINTERNSEKWILELWKSRRENIVKYFLFFLIIFKVCVNSEYIYIYLQQTKPKQYVKHWNMALWQDSFNTGHFQKTAILSKIFIQNQMPLETKLASYKMACLGKKNSKKLWNCNVSRSDNVLDSHSTFALFKMLSTMTIV